MPTARFIGAPALAVVIVDAVVALAAAVAAPDRLVSVGLGAAAALAGVVVGSALIRPWKARPRTAWPTLALGAQGISMGVLLASAVLLYSAAQPDAVAFVAAVALPFPVAMIAQAKLALAPTLVRSPTVGASP